MNEPLLTRKNFLHTLLRPGPTAQATDCVDGEGKTYFAATCEHGLEGIVAKLKSSLYQPGKRSSAWIKIKRVRESEFVIGGYTFDGSRRDPVKSLILGLFQGGRLTYVGQVSSGLAPHGKKLARLLEPLHVSEPPFDSPPRIQRFLFWCKPAVVCRVAYGEFTEDGRLAYPVFGAVREDVSPQECQTTEAPGWPRLLAGLG